jgi:hypothetical protein
MSKQETWEEALEDALTTSTPAEVLTILRKIKGWLVGYCVTCGVWNDTCGAKRGCNCGYKGEWYGDRNVLPEKECEECGFRHEPPPYGSCMDV